MFILAATLITSLVFYKMIRTSPDSDLGIFILPIMAGVGLMFAFGFIYEVIILNVPIVTETREENIIELSAITLADTGEIQGDCYLIGGSIDTRQYYKYYYLTSDRGKKFGKILADHVAIYEEERNDAYLCEEFRRTKYPEWTRLLFFGPGFKEEYARHIIRVPKGTVREKFRPDAS